MAAKSPASLEALFAPWRHANGALLGGNVLFPCRMLPRERTLWAIWYVPYDDPGVARACLECVQLLDLVAQIDSELYQRLLDEVLGELSTVITEHPECLTWRLGLQVQVDAGTDFALLRDCLECVNPADLTRPREQNRVFEDARRVLQSCVDERALRGAMPLWLSVWPGPHADDSLTQTLERVQDLAYDFAARAERARAFQLVDCCVELPCDSTISALLRLVIGIMQCGVRISWLAFSQAEDPEPVGPVALAQAIHSLLFPRVADDGVASVAISTDIEESFRAPLSSALMHTRSVRQIVLNTSDGGVDTTRSSWRWLALALFSSWARNSIERLEIDLTNLRSEDTLAIEAIVGADDPVAATMNPGQTNPQLGPRQIARLAPGTQVRLTQPVIDDMIIEPTEGDFRIPENLGAVTVIGERNTDSPWLKVLLPGIGPCWVLRDSARCEETEPGHGKTRINHLVLTGITELSAAPALAFVQLIAGRVKTLELRNMVNVLPAFPTWRAQCISASPMLQALTVDTHQPETIAAILQVANSIDHCRQLDTLRLEGINSARDFSSLHRLMGAMRDLRHPIATQLRHLTLCSSEMAIQHAAPLWCDVVDALVGVLRRNKKLVSCRVQLPRSARVIASHYHQFVSLDGEMLALRAGPLHCSVSLRCSAS